MKNKEVLNGEDWMEKYYPVGAETLADASDIECTQHSLNKWRGLTKEVLEKYGLIVYIHIIKGDNYKFYIDCGSCALCQKYIEKISSCRNCPLCKQLGSACDYMYDSPYNIFTKKGNPLPMIEALEKTLSALQKNKE